MDSADPSEIDDEIVQPARAAGDAWIALAERLELRAKASKRPCKKCHGTGVIISKKTGTAVDCDCVRDAA